MQETTARVRFPSGGAFHAELRERIDQYFARTGRDRHGGWRMALKSALLIGWLAGSWAALMFAPLPFWLTPLFAMSIGLAMAGVGFGVMHDANHGGYSRSPRVNRAMSFTLDLLGASSFLWRHKHNVMHHTYTNIAGLDADIEAGAPMLRLAPWQRRRWGHRFQHVYVWFLYGMFPFQWMILHDAQELLSGRMGGQKFPRPHGVDLAIAVAGKTLFLTWAFVLPIVFHPTWVILPLYFITMFTLGNTLASVFQLAHCVGQAEFVQPSGAKVESDWAQHQIATTVDFARKNKFLSWYLGGLNFQVEHHLFPHVCHIHYPALARIVEETCTEHGVRYRAEPTMRSALRSNWRWLRQMGATAA